jgi:tetratricopeptide (TPR) repeat protein
MSRLLILALALGLTGCRLPAWGKENRFRLNRIAEVVQEGDRKTAIAQLDGYLKDYPRDDLAWTILGNVYEDEDRDQEAQAAYDKALALNPRQADAVNGLGVLHRKRGDDDKAMESYERALRIEPANAQAYSSMAVIALRRSQDARALEWAKKAYHLDRSDAVVAANLAVAYHYNGDTAARDRMMGIAQSLGYAELDVLRKIYSGQLTLRD